MTWRHWRPGPPRGMLNRTRPSSSNPAEPGSPSDRRGSVTSTDDRSDAQTRLRKLNLTVLMPPVVGIGVLLITVDTHTWLDRIVFGVGVAVAAYAFVRWAHGDILRVAVPCLADRKSTRLNSSHVKISYAVFCL